MEGRKFIFAVPAKRRQDHSSQTGKLRRFELHRVRLKSLPLREFKRLYATLRPSET